MDEIIFKYQSISNKIYMYILFQVGLERDGNDETLSCK